MLIIRRSTYNAHLEQAKAEGHEQGATVPPFVFAAGQNLQEARHVARRVLHPDGSRGRALPVLEADDLDAYQYLPGGDRGGVLLRGRGGWGTDDEIAAKARRRGMIIVDVFSP